MMKYALLIAFTGLAAAACRPQTPADNATLDAVARDYLVLELAMGLHDDNHVDAWFGQEELRRAAVEERMSLSTIHDRAGVMAERLYNWSSKDGDELQAMRIANLIGRLQALMARVDINQGEWATFDEESRRLFGVAAPDHDAAHFDAILEKIDRLVPGDGSLAERVNGFQNRFVIPVDRVADVFEEAIAECRRRTLEYIDLPENESFRLEYVTDKPWSGYNWYEGDAQSLIQLNTELPIFIHRAVDLGCHEGYPGHHTYNALLERDLVDAKGWIEFTLYPLFSPQSLIAEGSGNYGVELAFPGNERIEFERRVLFPLAGLDATHAERYYELQALLSQLNYAGNEAARDYLNGDIDREAAAQWLVDYALSSPERARQRVAFFDTYRSYVINYNLGEDLVRNYVERDASLPAERWQRFSRLLSSPMQPSDLE
jgi:hypothetical protein